MSFRYFIRKPVGIKGLLTNITMNPSVLRRALYTRKFSSVVIHQQTSTSKRVILAIGVGSTLFCFVQVVQQLFLWPEPCQMIIDRIRANPIIMDGHFGGNLRPILWWDGKVTQDKISAKIPVYSNANKKSGIMYVRAVKVEKTWHILNAELHLFDADVDSLEFVKELPVLRDGNVVINTDSNTSDSTNKKTPIKKDHDILDTIIDKVESLIQSTKKVPAQIPQVIAIWDMLSDRKIPMAEIETKETLLAQAEKAKAERQLLK
jgi:hypothetical protein